MSIRLNNGVVLPDAPQDAIQSHPYAVVLYTVLSVTGETEIGYKYLIACSDQPFRYVNQVIDSEEENIQVLASTHCKVVCKTYNESADTWDDSDIGDVDSDMFAYPLSAGIAELPISMAAIAWSNHDVLYATVDETGNDLIVSETIYEVPTEYTDYDGTLLPTIPEEVLHESNDVAIIHISIMGIIDVYFGLVLSDDATVFVARGIDPSLGTLALTTLYIKREGVSTIILGSPFGSWTSVSQGDNSGTTQNDFILPIGAYGPELACDIIYATKDIMYAIPYANGEYFETDAPFYSTTLDKKLPDISHETFNYIVPADFLSSVAYSARRLTGNSSRMSTRDMSDILVNTGNYRKVFDKSIQKIDWDLPSVIPFMGFLMCGRLESVSSETVIAIEPMGFTYCLSLKSVDLPNVKHLSGMAFAMCPLITKVNIPSVKSIGESALAQCSLLTSLDVPEVEWLGPDCLSGTSITSISLPKLKVASSMCLEGCSKLATVDLPIVATVENSAFRNCAALPEISLPVCTSVGNYAFSSCSALASIELPLCESIGDYAFNACTSLIKLDLPIVSTIGSSTTKSSVFAGCSALDTLILRSDAVCVLSSVAADTFTDTKIASGSGYVYVPAALIDAYKADTNWSAYANQLRSIEDYPDVCGAVVNEGV